MSSGVRADTDLVDVCTAWKFSQRGTRDESFPPAVVRMSQHGRLFVCFAVVRGVDKGKDFSRDPIDGNKGVPPMDRIRFNLSDMSCPPSYTALARQRVLVGVLVFSFRLTGIAIMILRCWY